MYVSSILATHVVLVLMVLPKFLSLIPFSRAGPPLVLECYALRLDGFTSPSSLPTHKISDVRTSRKKLKLNGSWSNEALKEALLAWEARTNLKRVAKDFDILTNTLQRHIMGTMKSQKRGHKTFFSPFEEV
jgi:hypothetical protein